MKYFIAVLVIILSGCSRGSHTPVDSPTSGSIKIAVDESLKPLVDAEIAAFEGIYLNAHISPVYVSEAEAVQLLIADSVRLAVITRSLTREEKAAIEGQKIYPKEAKVALEGLALIVNPGSDDTLWRMAKVRELIGHDPGTFQLFVDRKAYPIKTSQEVIDYVSKSRNAVGLIGASWISDTDDSTANKFLETIKVPAIESNGDYYQPYQAYIAQQLYPLTRSVIINSREARSGLGTGFMSFVAGDKGQRVVLKAGLVPVTMPIRLVEISRENY